MGRTIHYSVEDDGQNFITEEEWQKLEKLQDRYNTSYNWTCENLSLERYSIHPNWRAWDETGLKVQEVWNKIHAEIEKPNGMQKLLDHGLIEVSKGGYRGSGFLMSGFTKVREDEHNAGLVVMFLLEASLIAPGIRIKVYDEGDYLTCPVIIQNGTMRPDAEELKSQIDYLEDRHCKAEAKDKEYWANLLEDARQFLKLSDATTDKEFFIRTLIRT